MRISPFIARLREGGIIKSVLRSILHKKRGRDNKCDFCDYSRQKKNVIINWVFPSILHKKENLNKLE